MNLYTKIQNLAKNRRIVFLSGNFNILHPGHFRLIRFAKESGDFLVVGVLNDSSIGAFIDEKLRLESIQSIHWIDYSFILQEPPEVFIKNLKPAIVVKGSEHEFAYNHETDIVAEYGGKLLFSSGDPSFSSLDLLRSEWRDLNYLPIKKPHNYLSRHDLDANKLLGILERMKRLKVCVIGDLIVDEYITCDTLGVSQEDPTIVVTPVMQKQFIGGAGIVAAHAKGLGGTVNYFSISGCDATAAFARPLFEEYGVAAHLYEDDSRPTTLKQRYRAADKTLLRVNHLRHHDINAELRQTIMANILETLEETDLLVFADFNYGCLPQLLVSEIIEVCRKRKIMMAADSQSSSQVGDVSRFCHTALMTPTEREVRLALQDFNSGLVVLAEKLRTETNAENVIVTLGAEGLLIQTGITKNNQWPTDRLPALNSAPKDIAGAGDSLLTCAAMALAAGADVWQAAYLGSLAAACQVGRIGNIPLTCNEIESEILK